MVTKERLEGNWNRLAGAVKERFGEISGDDLKHVQGDVEQLIGLIQQKAGQTREQAQAFIEDACETCGSSFDWLTGKASAYAGVASETLRDNYDWAASNAQHGYEYSIDSMRKRPMETVGIALGAGALFGLLLGMSMRRRH